MTPIPKARLLVIDDEVQILRLLKMSLETAGYGVSEATTGRAGLSEAASSAPDGIVLDLGLPDMDGLAVLSRLREWTQVPVLVLTVRNTEDDKVKALEGGADDYMSKPFGTRELTARVNALLRRAQKPVDSPILSFGQVSVDLSARLVRRAGEEVKLTVKEYHLLRFLLLNRGKVITHQHLLRELWGSNAEEQTHYLRVYMNHLRQKLEDDPSRPKFLKTESGVGYRLVAQD